MNDEEVCIRYPFYVIADRNVGPIIASIENISCLVGYQSKEHAELYIEQARDDSLIIATVHDCAAARQLAQGATVKATHMTWNTTYDPEWISFISLNGFL